MNEQIKIYEAGAKRQTFVALLTQMFKDLANSHTLAKRLFIRDRNAEYRQSIFGLLWSVFTPLSNTLVWIFLSASGAVKIDDTGLPYPVFVLIGTLLWAIFTESVNMPLLRTTGSRDLLTKVNFEKEAIILSGIYKLIFNTLIKLGIIALLFVFFRISPGFQMVLAIPCILLLMGFGMGIGLLLTPVGMLYKDISRIIPMILSFAMYLTPVVYKTTKFKSLESFLSLNPLTPIINSTRNLLTGGNFENIPYLLVIAFGTLVLVLIGWILFRISIPIIVERM